MSSTTIQFGITGAGFTTLPSLITYLENKGIGSVEATYMQTIVNLFLSVYAVYPSGTATKTVGIVYADSSMITAWEKFSKWIYDVAIGSFIGYAQNGAVGVFPTEPTDTHIENWIGTNRPDIDATGEGTVGEILGAIILDMNNYLIVNAAQTPALPTGDPQVPDNPVNIYAGLVSATLEQITRYLRAVMGSLPAGYAASDGTIAGMQPTKDVSPNSSSYGETSVPLLPDVVI
jgi:hypothetical protein